MELEAPIRQQDNSFIVKLNVLSSLQTTYTSRERDSHSTPPLTLPVLETFLRELAVQFEAYSKRWFTAPILPIVFTKRLSHKWNYGEHPPYRGETESTQVCQLWYPESLHVHSRMIELSWRLMDVSYNQQPSGMGSVPKRNEQNSPQESQRQQALRKVREARVQAAISRAYADQLIHKYYKRYGTIEMEDGAGSILSDSSDDESTESDSVSEE